MPRMLCATVVLSLFLMATGTKAATIDYAPNGPVVEFWGAGAGASNISYGQTFTAPEAILQSYSLIVAQGNQTSFPFVSQIYHYQSAVVGPALFTSAVSFTTTNFTAYTFFPNINLIAGDQYIAVVTNDPNGVSLGGNDPIIGGLGLAAGTDTVTAGFHYATGDPSIGANWLCTGPGLGGCLGTALAFHAEFSDPAPLPAALPLFATGLGALGLLGWRRKRKQSA